MADKSLTGELQGKVNALFVPPADSNTAGLLKSAAVRTVPKRFNEFRDEDMKEMTEFLLELHRAADKQTDKKRSILDVINQCHQARTAKNPLLVKKALAIFLTHSPQAQELGIVAPPLKVQKRIKDLPPPKISPVTADTLRGYDLISYFREDHDINDHHWHWHLVYPYSGIVVNGKKVRALDRQGELFLYMHSQMLARYNTELVCWDHDITHAWSYGDFTTFGYTPPPSLQDQYTVRPPHTGWQDSDGTPTTTMDKWRNNILKAIENESIKTVKGADKKTPGEFPLDKSNAMNWIGMITESLSDYLQEVKPNSGEFVDRDLYGMLHNMGHDKFASIPPSPGIDGNGVMGHTQTAVRDAVFWLWHRHIDDFRLAIIKKYEHSMDEYKPEAKITGLAILPQDLNSKTPAGGLSTILGPPQLHLDESTAKINHEPYKWEIKVESTQAIHPTTAKAQTFTVRLFIIPKEFVRLQRHRSWIEMDKFTYHLKAKTATITRLDTESSVARKTLALKPGQEPIDPRCLCGWPQNMMLPVGRPDGMKFVAFAMLTNNELGEGGTKAISFCGAKNRVYPDPLGMGYPFDKMWSENHFRGDSTDAIPLAHEVDVAASEKMPHMMVTDFAIYRTTDKEVPTPKTD